MIFTRLDQNQDGVIAADEIPADQADRIKASDSNGDGNIEKQEMMQAIRARMAAGGGPPS
jgi:hypothetical protein